MEKRRCADGRVVDRQVVYLGEINDSQKAAWEECIEVFDEVKAVKTRLALYPADRPLPAHATDYGVQLKLGEFSLRRPRQWSGCWSFLEMWRRLHLDRFWSERLPPSREGTSWYHLLVVLAAYRLNGPGSEWRLHREWYDRSAMGDLLGLELPAKEMIYRALDLLVEHKAALFQFLRERWEDLFGVNFDVLLSDLTSTYFESDPPFPENDKRKFGYPSVMKTAERCVHVEPAGELGAALHSRAPYSAGSVSGILAGAMSNPSTSTTQNLKFALSREEASRALGVSAITIDRLTKRGLLRPSRATRRPLYPVWEVERFLRDTSTVVGKTNHGR